MASVLLRGFVLGFLIAASPGPIFFLCLRRTLARGWLTGVMSGLGVATADAFYAAVAAFGIGAVTSLLAGERRWLVFIGGAVLILIGLRSVFDRPAAAEVTQSPSSSGLAWAYLSTLGLTMANPATIISFAALVATLGIAAGAGLVPPTLLVAGVFVGSATWWVALAGLGAGMRARFTPRVVRGISRFSGIAIAALGMLAIYSAFS
jgi:threonine/homoserine/homoserine lactone efflux protein